MNRRDDLGLVRFMRRLILMSSFLTLAGYTVSVITNADSPFISNSVAAEGDGGGKGKGPSGGKGGEGKGQGSGGKKGVPGASGGDDKRPPWAKEGIPAVELGRLSVARSPSKVLDRALAEALAAINPALYTLPTLAAVLEALKTGKLPDGSELVRIDSPLQNLALLRDMLTDLKIGDGSKVPVTNDNLVLLAAIFIGSASDKTLPISVDTVKAVIIILGLQDKLTESQINDIATAAESVRQAILEEHGT